MARHPGGTVGVTALAVASTRAVVDRVRDAAARGVAMRIAGHGTWLDAGRPVRFAESLGMRDHAGIVDYVPGDLTVTVRAGTTLAEIREATSAHRQWLALDPHGTDEGTIGATVATASAGPLSTGFGLPRDLVLGIEFVTGMGAVVRGGGRVVKNVAGFDLTRLVTGSWGTLGAITEVTMRLHARPEVDVTYAVPLDGERADIERVRQFLRRAPFTPFACEVLDAASAEAVGAGKRAVAIMRVGGNPEAARAHHAALREIADPVEVDAALWTRLRAVEPLDAIVFRLSERPSQIGELWDVAMRVAAACPGTVVHARPARGIVRCIVPRTDANVAWLAPHFAEARSHTRIGERMPDALWPACGRPPAGDSLSRGIKAKFDPANILNPGILGDAT